jgi:hypothetical protein
MDELEKGDAGRVFNILIAARQVKLMRAESASCSRRIWLGRIVLVKDSF